MSVITVKFQLFLLSSITPEDARASLTFQTMRSRTPPYLLYYYIYTEIYSLKSHFVNFPTQMNFNQSEERTRFLTREKKNDTSNQNCERCFFTCEKNDPFNQKPQLCVSLASKFPPFIGAKCR